MKIFLQYIFVGGGSCMVQKSDKKTLFLFIALLVVSVGLAWQSGMIRLRIPSYSFSMSTIKSALLGWLKKPQKMDLRPVNSVRVTTEESVIIDVVENVSPSVVTVGISKTQKAQDFLELDPFNFFGPMRRIPGKEQKIEQDIGTGFVVAADGLIVTNKHVVEDTEATYRVITKDDKTYTADRIFRDPTNDIAILKIAATGLKPVTLGDSAHIKVGQLAIAIGTALGEFRHTVTTGVISGVGRGISAGNPFEGYVERLDNVIQTDASINPGNSGGPLLNSSGDVVGINVAVSKEGQNIGFAIPINVVSDALANFNKNGKFDRAYLGIRYKTIGKDQAILNDIPEGAYVIEAIAGSPVAKAGVKQGDIITAIDDVKISGQDAELSKIVGTKKPGDTLTLSVYRDGKKETIRVTLGTWE